MTLVRLNPAPSIAAPSKAKVVVFAVGVSLAAIAAHAVLANRDADCPFASQDPRALEDQRRAGVAPLRGERPAPSEAKVAGAFELEKTSPAEVRSREERGGAQCEEELGGALLRCISGASATPQSRAQEVSSELVARFDPEGRLVGVDRVTYGVSSVRASEALDSRRGGGSPWGAPSHEWGESSASYLGSPLRQAGVTYRFSDVAVDVTVTNMGERGLLLREQWRALSTDKKT